MSSADARPTVHPPLRLRAMIEAWESAGIVHPEAAAQALRFEPTDPLLQSAPERHRLRALASVGIPLAAGLFWVGPNGGTGPLLLMALSVIAVAQALRTHR